MPPAPRSPVERLRYLTPLFAAPHAREHAHEQRHDAAQRECREGFGHIEGPF
jgi:hypothetical protein